MVIVSIADLKTVIGEDVLVTYALGSCVGICLRDDVNKVSGLAHIMLPWSKTASEDEQNMRRFADTGITELMQQMVDQGAKSRNITAKLAGGAQMFGVASAAFNIGERNIQAVQKVLETYKISVAASDLGGNYARTIYFHTVDGKLEVRSATRPTIFI